MSNDEKNKKFGVKRDVRKKVNQDVRRETRQKLARGEYEDLPDGYDVDLGRNKNRKDQW